MEKREVVFTEEKLGLTLKSEDQVDPMGYRIPVTIVKSTIFSVGQVSHQIREGDVLQSVNGERLVEDRDDDSDSQGAVLSESFGDADSTRTTEDSSVFADFSEIERKSGRQSSRLAAFLRKPFRRSDGFDESRWELRTGILPASPRAEIVHESPSKAAILISWRAHPKALAYHLQFSRDWTMKVWKNWSGRPRPSSDDEHELMTTIFGLDHAKTYVVRVRYEFGSAYTPGEWSSPSAPITTVR
ncbi:hypothetical protein BBJ29_005280 [Phytophthora kernoviae]|uniref:Fibronectin type-III domain-containing protein n=1 Tax=Phytophthora kernoviae TaxID=325452 RepID=A0A3F2S0D1_9STRA|nr:hypothetical protein BBJ29_005280 [Phytophthora kernoviae]RLN67250.1 hypothetical protein BBP00_00001743 [Phytophthora kernoviae]